MGDVSNVVTPRMRLVLGTRALAEAELAGNARLAQLLEVEVPASWPPEAVREVLPVFFASCERSGVFGPWSLGWYGVLHDDGQPVLCGSIGFKHAPTPTGMVELGYSVLPAFRRRGVATEMVLGASRWALAQPVVLVVEAEVDHDNLASARVLEKAGFSACGAGIDPGTRRFRLV